MLTLNFLGGYTLWDNYIKRIFRKVFQYATLFHYVLAHLVKYNKSWTADDTIEFSAP